MKPEEQAREQIDNKLRQAGWSVVNRDEYHHKLAAAAIREALMQGQHEADYLLLLHGKAVGVVEAKRADVRLDSPEFKRQALAYADMLPPHLPSWKLPLPLVYLTNGKQILRHDGFASHAAASDFVPKARFMTPAEVQSRIPELNQPDTKNCYNEFMLLPPCERGGMRACQHEAITKFEASLQEGQRRALIVMATGAGKTRTACHIVYRLLRYTHKIRSVLFLVDRTNLGRAAKTAFESYEVDGVRPFATNYGVDSLTVPEQLTKQVQTTAVHVCTIQRLYSILSGQEVAELEGDEQGSIYASDEETAGKQVSVPEQALIPPDAFDLIIIDECHRSIYSTWRLVLDYFSSHALLLGLTATPIEESLVFFQNNVVSNYSLQRSVEDGVNVPPRIYRIKTQLSEHGGQINPGEEVSVTSNYTGRTQLKTANTELPFAASELNRAIMAPDQIRTILREYKDVVYKVFYPTREPNYDYLPKTLIFARNERHAQMVVALAKEVFNRPANDNHFAQAITYSAPDSTALIRSFCQDKDFRIAVTVTLVATGTDVPPLEVLLFLSEVRSQVLYQQMKGRGVRTISDDHLREVTPNADHKDNYVLIDAVGVTEHEKIIPSLTQTQPNLTLERLLEELSRGVVSDDNMLLLAQKITTIANRGDPDELEQLKLIAPQLDLLDLARAITFACAANADYPQGELSHQCRYQVKVLPPFVDSNEPNLERKALLSVLLDDIPARKKLVEIARGYVKVLPQQRDTLIYSGFSQEDAAAQVELFERSINELAEENEHMAHIRANDIDAQELTAAALEELRQELMYKMPNFSVKKVWDSYELLEHTQEPDTDSQDAATSRVVPLDTHSEDECEAPTNLLQLTRYAWHNCDRLVSLANNSHLTQMFNLWCGQTQNDLPMDEVHKELYQALAQYIAINGAVTSIGELYALDTDLCTNLCATFGVQEVQRPLNSLNRFLLLSA